MSFRDELIAALGDPSAEDVVAEGIASGELIIVNRHSVSPGGLRWVEFYDDLDGACEGWALGTGCVVLRDADAERLMREASAAAAKAKAMNKEVSPRRANAEGSNHQREEPNR